VEVLWPNGRLQREYTMLLDPPLYTAHSITPVAVTPPATAAASAPRKQPSAARPTVAATQPATTSTATATSLAGNEYKTTANDNLWDIANRARAGGSVHQAMLAIQELNPQAFIDNNINRMKSGQVLRLPDAQQINSRTQSAAIAQVNQQTAAWREGRSIAASARQLDASKRSSAAVAPAKIESSDNLKLVADGSDKGGTGSDKGSAGNKALLDKLAVAQESLDSTNRENAELKSRIADLQSQLDKLQRLVQLKNDQMAKLQAYLAAQGQAPAATPDVAEATTGNQAPSIP
jgi:pilus assembly protein FimV